MSASLRSPVPGSARQPAPGRGRLAVPQRRLVPPEPQARLSRSGTDDELAQRADPTGGPGRPSRPALPRRADRPGSRLGRHRVAAGLAAVCVLALGVAACSLKDAKAEASASASASASAAIARAEKGIAEANASATASREAALTPELRAQRDTALAEPAPVKPLHMDEESARGATGSVQYYLELYRYAFMTGNTTEIEAMSENGCVFCKSVIDQVNDLHKNGGWANKWDQDITNIRYYEKLEGYNYNLIHVHINYGQMTWCHPGENPETAEPIEGQELKFGVRYVNGHWMVGEGEVISK